MKTILTNGKFYIEKDQFAEAVLIKDGIIVQVGAKDEVCKMEVDQIIDLGGKTVLPGLNDSHLHLIGMGSTMGSCILTGARSIDDLIRLGREFLNNNPGLPVLQGRGWNQDYFTSGEKRMPTKSDLDKISSEIPIVFIRVCGHVATGNTRALELLGVDGSTKVPGGLIELGPDMEPNGIFSENAVDLLRSIIPDKTREYMEADFLKAANYAINLGITSVQSCDVSRDNPKLVFDLVRDIYKNERTKLRYSHQFNFQEISDLENYLETEDKTGEYGEKFLSKGALKLFIDGSLGGRTALMIDDYKDEPGSKGVQILTADELDEICGLASQNEIRIITHAIGDGAVEMIINAYEKILVDGANPLRHGIVHCQITNQDQLERIAQLNIPLMFQPIFLDYDLSILEDRVGKDLASTSYAFNTLYQLGAPVSFGTDSPVEDCNPWHNLYWAVTRMNLQDAIDCYTYGSAYNEFKEDFKGRLKPGFVADLIVLDRDIFTIDHEEIKDIVVEKVMIDGSFIKG